MDIDNEKLEFLKFLNSTGKIPSVEYENKHNILELLYCHYKAKKTDIQKENAQMEDINSLKIEINDVMFNHGNITNDDMEKVLELFKTWKKAHNNKTIIENINGSQRNGRVSIKIKNRVLIDTIDFRSEVTTRTTLHFINCNDVNIAISSKINHLVLENCMNMLVKTTGGFISGLDSIRCTNVIHVFDEGNINYIDINKSHDCKYFFQQDVVPNTIIQTIESMDILLVILKDMEIKERFKVCTSFLDTFKRYKFEKMDNKIKLIDSTTQWIFFE
jgi:hypothetical protein